jgi:hypothetical protein
VPAIAAPGPPALSFRNTASFLKVKKTIRVSIEVDSRGKEKDPKNGIPTAYEGRDDQPSESQRLNALPYGLKSKQTLRVQGLAVCLAAEVAFYILAHP